MMTPRGFERLAPTYYHPTQVANTTALLMATRAGANRPANDCNTPLPPYTRTPAPPQVRKLFKSVEFVAISAYAPVDPGSFGPNDLQRSAQMADEELSQWGVSSLKKKKLYYGE